MSKTKQKQLLDPNTVDPDVVDSLFQIKKNQVKMVSRRGYNTDKEMGLFNLTPKQFFDIYYKYAMENKKSFRSAITKIYENTDGHRLVAYFADTETDKKKGTEKQLGKGEIENIITYMNKEKVKNAIIITKTQLSPDAVKHINKLPAYNIQIFLEKEMMYDPTEHFLVPNHIPLSLDEQRKFIESNNINVDDLPVILSSDVISRYYGLRGGRIVRIERENMFETIIIKSVTYKMIKE